MSDKLRSDRKVSCKIEVYEDKDVISFKKYNSLKNIVKENR